MIIWYIASFKRCNTVENKKESVLQERFPRDYQEIKDAWSMVTCEEPQDDLHLSGCSVTKQMISNEMLRNGLKS